MQWSRLSDHVGRKPVLLFGLAGTLLSTLLFGLSRTFWTLVVSRCLCGLLNGNSGVMKSAVGELTDASNRAQASSLMGMVWAAGSTLGPLIGGSLSRPHERFPSVFTGQFWMGHPYFLPCVAVASFIGFVFTATLFFLKETAPRHRKYAASSHMRTIERPVALRGLLVYPVLISVSNYMSLAFLDIMLGALLPLFFAMPIEIGGLGFEPSTIGYIMGMYGLGNGIFQVLFFARIVRRFGTRSVLIGGMMNFIPICILFLVMSAIAQHFGVNIVVWSIIALMMPLMSSTGMAHGCVFMYVTASSPNKQSLGATNGLAQTSVSLARAFVYLVMLIISCLAVLLAARLPEKVWEEKEGNETEHS
ncbi:major facilitator superfamily domain-containing protein [Infundibulicybe gibba]|nr:major facilitator superfamily domain-containing protein [Infundibulicybe gibba]